MASGVHLQELSLLQFRRANAVGPWGLGLLGVFKTICCRRRDTGPSGYRDARQAAPRARTQLLRGQLATALAPAAQSLSIDSHQTGTATNHSAWRSRRGGRADPPDFEPCVSARRFERRSRSPVCQCCRRVRPSGVRTSLPRTSSCRRQLEIGAAIQVGRDVSRDGSTLTSKKRASESDRDDRALAARARETELRRIAVRRMYERARELSYRRPSSAGRTGASTRSVRVSGRAEARYANWPRELSRCSSRFW
jgi:hypothetical protein